jgi:hypothetical protein
VCRLLGQSGHLTFALGAGPGGGDGNRPQLVLRCDELLRALVVDDEVLDVLIPRDEAPLDRRDGRATGEEASSRAGAADVAAADDPGARGFGPIGSASAVFLADVVFLAGSPSHGHTT